MKLFSRHTDTGVRQCSSRRGIYAIVKSTSVGDDRLSVVGVAGWPVNVTVGVVEVDLVDTRYGRR